MSKRMMMPQNMREEIIFTVMCCLFMCSVMLTYNMIMAMGFTWAAIQQACMLFPLTILVCFCLDFFVACPIAKLCMRKLGPVIKKPFWCTVVFQVIIVTQVVIMESMYGAIMAVGFHNDVWLFWLHHMPLNAMVAYPTILLVCSPIVRFFFRLLCPVGQLKGKGHGGAPAPEQMDGDHAKQH